MNGAGAGGNSGGNFPSYFSKFSSNNNGAVANNSNERLLDSPYFLEPLGQQLPQIMPQRDDSDDEIDESP